VEWHASRIRLYESRTGVEVVFLSGDPALCINLKQVATLRTHAGCRTSTSAFVTMAVGLHGGPDHYARLAATKHLRDFMAAGRPAPKPAEKQERRGLTLPELRELVEHEQSAAGTHSDVAA
jgi:hypothetical protein